MLDTINSAPDVPSESCTIWPPEPNKRAKVAVPLAAMVSSLIADAVITPPVADPKPASVCVASTVLELKLALAFAGGVPLYMTNVPVPKLVPKLSACSLAVAVFNVGMIAPLSNEYNVRFVTDSKRLYAVVNIDHVLCAFYGDGVL